VGAASNLITDETSAYARLAMLLDAYALASDRIMKDLVQP